ncbi:MAG: hypothetical protein V4603_12850 [Pseudomonadota bacterium]
MAETDSEKTIPDQGEVAAPNPDAREYDRTGFYPQQGKSFRIWALLGWNIGVVVALAAAAALLNYILL